MSLLKKLKYIVNRKTLSQLYTVYIRPLLEYASDVWDGCSQGDIDKIEKVQLEAARVVTGLTILSSRISLYLETGWEPLINRRRKSKLVTMYKINNGMSPSYLTNLLPMNRIAISGYETRNSANFDMPACRLDLFKKSFFPSTIDAWNNLSNETKTVESIYSFKQRLSNETESVPKYFNCGPRYTNIVQTRIRHNCSALKADLFRKNISDNPCCECGLIEDSYHFFFVCHNYTDQRRTMLTNLMNLYNFMVIDCHLLLWGDEQLSEEINESVFKIVQIFIKHTNRFK